MQKAPSKLRIGFVHAIVTGDIPGTKKGKRVRISERRARDKNWMNRHGLTLLPDPLMPLSQPEPVTPMATETHAKPEPMKPTKVKI